MSVSEPSTLTTTTSESSTLAPSTSALNTSSISPPKLYLLTNEEPIEILLEKLETAFKTDVISILQIRRKQHKNNLDRLKDEIEKIMRLASTYNVSIIINDDVLLAQEFGTGVHIGKQDTDLKVARHILGEHTTIGKTCYNSLTQVNDAIDNKASYVAMGAVFPSTTKPSATRISYEQVQQGAQLCQQKGGKLCVIGGISSDNIGLLKGLEIGYIAVTADILGQSIDDIGIKCQHWQLALDTWFK